MPAHSAAGRIKAATVGIRVGGDKARAIATCAALAHHVPVVERVSPTMTKSGFTSVRQPRFIELVNERAFAHDIRFTFLTA